MTREEKLYSMTMVNLVEVANKLGIKIDKKGAKSKAVAKILEAENIELAKQVKEMPAEELEDIVAEVMEQKKELGIECPPIESVEIVSDECAGDGTPLAEVGKEIAEQAKQKAKKVNNTVKLSKNDVTDKLDELGCKYVVGSKRDIVVKSNDNKNLAVIYVGAKMITLYYNSDVAKSSLAVLGFNVESSKEKFNYYTRIDINTLEKVIPMITA